MMTSRHHVIFLGGPGVSYEEFRPPPQLAPWVAVCWRIRSTIDFDLRVLPDGCMDLIGGEDTTDPVAMDLVGSLSQPLVAHLRAGERVQGIRFRPGGFPALFGIPADELVDHRLLVREAVPGMRRLRDLAIEASPPDPLARAISWGAGLADLARDSGYSERQVRRRVLRATGHGPKKLMRIGRMQRVLAAGRGESWARTAAEHGYFDEAHMANDVRALAGATPHQMLR